MNKSRGGKGMLRETEQGRIIYRFPYYDEFDIRREKSFTCDTAEECLMKADEFLQRIAQKMVGIELDATIPDILYAKVESDYKKNYTNIQGYDRNLATIRIIEKSMIGHMPIADIHEPHVDAFLQYITKYADTVIRKIYSMLKTAFKMAYDKKVITTDIMAGRNLRCPNSSKPKKIVRGLTEEEQKKFVKTLKEHKVPYGRNDYRNQLLIELYSGLRMGEINALKPENINFKKNFIHVERTISRGLNSQEFLKEGTKTNAGRRDVPISKVLEPILRLSLAEMKNNPEGLIFYDYNKDSVVSTTQVSQFFNRICEKAGIPVRGQHVLRHTFATRCIEADVPAIVLKNWLGHTNIHITLDTYADVFDRMNLGAISKLDMLMDTVMKEDDAFMDEKE